jgi:hypothetical protein
VLLSRRFYNSILTGEKSTVAGNLHYESRCLLSPMGVLRV